MTLKNPFLPELPPIDPLPEPEKVPWGKRKAPIWKQIIVGISAAIILHALFFTALMMFGSTYTPFELYSQAMAKVTMNHAAYTGSNNMIVLNITSDCKDLPADFQPECVHTRVAQIYHYVANGSDDHYLLTPDEFVAKGGVCRDVAIVYGAIFEKLGWSVEYQFPISEHVTTLIKRVIPCQTDGMHDCSIYCEFNNDDLEYCARMGAENGS